MKVMNAAEMKNVNAGAKVTKSATCSWCGKKHSYTASSWIYLVAYCVAVIGASNLAKKCAKNDACNALK